MKPLALRRNRVPTSSSTDGCQIVTLRDHRLAQRVALAPFVILSLFLGLFVPLLGIASEGAVAYIILALLAMLVATGVLWAGIAGKRWAYAAIFFIVALIMEGTLRRREMASTGMDGQTLLKLSVWGGALLIGFIKYSRTLNVLRSIPGLAWLGVFSIWAIASTAYSLTPAYTFGAGFAFLALVVFTAAAADRLGPDKLLLPMVYACGVPCITIRENTERPVTVEEGSNVLAGTDPMRIVAEVKKVLRGEGKQGRRPHLWDGRAAERIVEILAAELVRA